MPDLARRYRLSLLLVYTSAGAPREGIAVASALGGEEWLTKAVDAENYMSRGFYGMMLAWMGRLAEGRAHLDAALAVGEREQRATSWMYAFRVDIAWMSGDHAGVLPQAQQALLRAEASGSTYFRALGLRALGFAYVLQGDAAAAVPLLERVRPLLAKGQNAHQFEAHSLAILARAYAGAGRLDEAFATARAAIDSGQRSQSRVWEISAWLALFEIPGEGPWTAMVETGLQRVEALIALTGAASAEPWCWEARARHARTPDERSLCLARAIEGFRGIGALAHVQRLAGATADMPSSAAAPSMSSSGTLAGTLAGTPAERLAAASSTPQRG
jgi:adenylate cyclase